MFNPTLKTIVATDASDYGLGAVLLQVHGGSREPTAGGLRILYTKCCAEKLFDGRMGSPGVSVRSGKVARVSRGREFTNRTDHQALVTLLGSSGSGRVSMRIPRWLEHLRNYNFRMEYKSGVTNNVPDMLFRLPIGEHFSVNDSGELVIASLTQAERPFRWDELQDATRGDTELQEVARMIKTKDKKNARKWGSVWLDLAMVDGVLMKEDKIVLPASLRARAFRLAHHDAHQGFVRTKQRLREHFWWPSMDRFIEDG